MSLRSPLGRVRGLGSAHHGTQHFIQQRFTAILLVPLLGWFLAAVILVDMGNHAAVVKWMQSPINAVLLLLLLVNTLHHGQLGVQVVIEDYVSSHWQKLACLVLVRTLVLVAGLAAALSVLRVFLGF